MNTLGAGTTLREVYLRLVKAAVAAKAQRIIPSEFDSDTTNPETAKVPAFGSFKRVECRREAEEVV